MDVVIRQLLNPIVQTGAFALCLVLVGVIVWLAKKMMQILSDLIQKTNVIITENTEAIREHAVLAQDTLKLQRDNQKLLIQALAKSNGVKS